jgi:dienelactone hydrolase
VTEARARGLLALCLLGTGPAGAATEEVVRLDIGGTAVAATLERPAGDPAPVVLMLHGFTGSRDELAVAGTDEGVFSRTARQLAEAGYASLRIDFRGSGESGGAWQDTTFSGQIADAVAAIDWLEANPAVDGSRLAVLGWSQGGLVAAHAAAERAGAVDALVLWAPVASPLHSFEALLGAAALTEALAAPPDTPIVGQLPWGGTTTLRAAFFQELGVTSPPAAVARYGGPLKVIVGARDDVVAPQPAAGEIFLRYHEGAESLSVFDTDHVWSAFTGPEVLDGQMIPATLDWLNTHLGL